MHAEFVYLVRDGSNPELRHSLRSLEQFGPDITVHMIGAPPSWVNRDTVNVILNPRQRTAGLTTASHLLLACGEMPGPFVLMNDDFFALQPRQPMWDRGPMEQVLADLRRRYRGQARVRAYLGGLSRTLALLRSNGHHDPLSYDFHAPLLVHPEAMREALDLGQGIVGVHKRSVYGNLAGLDSTTHPDVLIHIPGQAVGEDWPWVATTDYSWRTQPVGEMLRERFSTPSRYEVDR